jgi:TRAP-type C4-dicarboxylate transport system permease small subunit
MPITLTLATEIFFFAFTLWLGAYLLARNSHNKATIILTESGLVAYALALAIEILFGSLIIRYTAKTNPNKAIKAIRTKSATPPVVSR